MNLSPMIPNYLAIMGEKSPLGMDRAGA